jgi:Rrf2 family protein
VRFGFSRRTDYAIRAAVELAHGDGLRKRHQIAAATDAPPSVVAQALADLVRGDIAVALAGRNGGYRLRRPADEISVLDVVRSVEGPEPETRCVLHERACSHAGPCPLHDAVRRAAQAYLEELRRETLADVVARFRGGRPAAVTSDAGLEA